MKLMRSKVVAIVVTLAMVFSILAVPVANAAQGDATTIQAADFLKSKSLLQGNEQGDLMLDSTFKRQDAIVVLSRLMGKEAEAKAFSADEMTFKDVTDDYYKPYVAWAYSEGYTEGYSEDVFGFNDLVTAWQVKAFFVRALGYVDTTDEEMEAKATELGISKGSTADSKAPCKRADMALLMYNTLYAQTVEGDILGEALKVLEVKPAVAPVLSDVKASETSTSADTVTVTGKVAPATATVKVAGAAATVAADGTFSAVVTLDKNAANGVNNIAVEATNDKKTDTKTVAVTYVVGFAVASVSPADKATEVLADSDILINFNKDLDTATVVNSCIQVKEKATGIVSAGVASYDKAKKQIKFDITGALKNSAEINVTVFKTVKDADGKALAADYTFGFTTSNSPVVQSQDPTTTTAWSDNDVQVVFNKAMDGSTLTTGSVKLLNVTDNKYIPGTVGLASDGKTLTYTVDGANVEADKSYNLIITTAAKDLNGVAVSSEIKKTFVRSTAPGLISASTSISGDTSAAYADVYPKITASGGYASFRILLQFNKDMDPATVNNSTITVRDIDADKDVVIDVTYDAGSRYATIVPKADLIDDTNYEIRFDYANIKSAAGLSAGSITAIPFDTGDFSRPTVVSSTPAQGTADVKTDADIKVVFSEKLSNASTTIGSESLARLTRTTAFTTVANAPSYASNVVTAGPTNTTTANNAIYRLKNESTGAWVDMTSLGFAAAVSAADKSITFTHSSRLTDNTTYSLYIRGEVSGQDATNVTDGATATGNYLKDEFKVTFTTAAADQTAPRILAVKWNDADLKDAYNVDNTKSIKVTFDEAVTAASAAEIASFDDATGTAEDFTVAYSTCTLEDSGKTLVIPTSELDHLVSTNGSDSKYTVTIQNVKDTSTAANTVAAKAYEFYSGPRPVVNKFDANAYPQPFAVSVPVATTISIAITDTNLDTSTLNTSNIKLVKAADQSVVDTAILSSVSGIKTNGAAYAAGTTVFTLKEAAYAKAFAAGNTVTIAGESRTVSSVNTTAGTITTDALVTPIASGVEAAVVNTTAAAKKFAFINPTNNLDSNTFYTVVIKGVKDVIGNTNEDVTYTFKTADTSAPVVESVTPADGAMGQATNTNVTVKFAQAMTVSTINTTNIKLTYAANGVEIPCELTYDTTTNTATLNPVDYLALLTAYTVTVKSGTTGVKGLNGVAMTEDKVVQFGTGASSTQGLVTGGTWNDIDNNGSASTSDTITVFFDVPLSRDHRTGTLANFTHTAAISHVDGTAVSIDVDSSAALAVGDSVIITGHETVTVVTVPDGTHFTAVLTADLDDAAHTITAASALTKDMFTVTNGSLGTVTPSYAAGNKYASFTLGANDSSIASGATTIAPVYNTIFDRNPGAAKTAFATTAAKVTKN